jgi:hypothetical protein
MPKASRSADRTVAPFASRFTPMESRWYLKSFSGMKGPIVVSAPQAADFSRRPFYRLIITSLRPGSFISFSIASMSMGTKADMFS